jgi:hypothetical protein
MAKKVSPRFAVCIDNSGYLASLELHKLYRVLPDPTAERDGALRVVDESGEHYLFDADRFLVVDLPQESSRVLNRSFTRSHESAR